MIIFEACLGGHYAGETLGASLSRARTIAGHQQKRMKHAQQEGDASIPYPCVVLYAPPRSLFLVWRSMHLGQVKSSASRAFLPLEKHCSLQRFLDSVIVPYLSKEEKHALRLRILPRG